MPIRGFQPSFAGGVIGPGLYGRVDLAKYDVGLRAGVNIFIQVSGGFSNRAGFEYVGDVDDSTKEHRLIPFERDDELNYILCFGNSNMQPVFQGAFVNDPTRVTVTTPYAVSNDLFAIDYHQSINVQYFAHRSYAPRKMTYTSATSWAFAAQTFNPTVAQVSSLTATPRRAGAESYYYTVTAVNDDGVEGFNVGGAQAASAELLSVAGAENVVTWNAASGADYYRIYRQSGGIYGYIGFSETTTFTDDNFAPDPTVTYPVSTSLFGSTNNYPGVVTIAKERLFYGGSNNEPEHIWGSKISDYDNFTRAKITVADDRFEANLSGPSINSVRGLLGMTDLVAFGGRGEFVIGSDGVISATSPAQTQTGWTGSSGIKPLVCVDTALFVSRNGDEIRDLRYAFEQNGYAGNELSILASHFFSNKKVKDWTFAQAPHSIVWTVMDDGTLLSLTYKREHQVWGWTEHDVAGAFVESVATVNEDGYDAVYIIARKTINSVEKRAVLRLDDRRVSAVEDSFFVDYGIKYDGAATTSITGLDHLEGETVVALADGNVVAGLVVASGAVTLPVAASKVNVGLPYVSYGQTLPPAIDIKGEGSSRGRPANVNSIGIQIEKSRGLRAGTDFNDQMEDIQVGGADISQPIAWETGFVSITVPPNWVVDGGGVYVTQEYPLPMTILAIAPDLTLGY